MVTEAERDYALSGKFDQLVEQQRRIDEERDAEVIFMMCLSEFLFNCSVECTISSLHS